MVRVSTASLAIVGLLLGTACSGKTERGIGGEAAAEKPAAGPTNMSDSSDAPQPSTDNDKRHVLMVVELELATRAAKTLKARPVELPLPRKRGPVQKGPWQVDVLDAAGAVLYSAPLADASTLRGEFPDDQGKLSGVRVEKAVAAVTLRLPLLTDAVTVRVSSVDGGKGSTELGSVAYPKVQP